MRQVLISDYCVTAAQDDREVPIHRDYGIINNHYVNHRSHGLLAITLTTSRGQAVFCRCVQLVSVDNAFRQTRRLPSMRALALETSARVGSVALIENGEVLVEQRFAHGLQNAAQMLPVIDSLCVARHWKPAALQCLYVSCGPGSFTGLRIGITLAKTLAFATGAKIVAVPTLPVIALNAPADAVNLVLVLDAKRGQIFTARFVRTADGWDEAEAAHLDTLTAMLERSPRPVHLIGDGIPIHRPLIPSDATDIILTVEDTWHPRASAVALLGARLAAAGQFADPYKLTPIYIRKPEAEERFEAGLLKHLTSP